MVWHSSITQYPTKVSCHYPVILLKDIANGGSRITTSSATAAFDRRVHRREAIGHEELEVGGSIGTNLEGHRTGNLIQMEPGQS